MTNCPPKLRGDLSKWLCEINTGVYVGNVSSRVRDALWERGVPEPKKRAGDNGVHNGGRTEDGLPHPQYHMGDGGF